MTIGFSTLYLAQILGVYFLVMGTAMLVNKQYYQSTFVSIMQNGPILLMTGFLALVLGMIMLVFHNIWVMGWPVIITILAWATLIKGILRLMLPVKFFKHQIRLIQNNVFFYICAIILIIVGAFLAYMGFFEPQALRIEIRV